MSRDVPSGPITILFSDVVDSTALTSALGDDASRRLFREHDSAIRAALAEHGGHEVKTMGDGFMAWFASVSDGVACAQSIQSRMATLSRLNDHDITVRIGLNVGEPIREDDDLHGTAVIVAARVAALAHAGEVLVTDVVRALLAGKQFGFAEHGAFELKGIPDKMHVHRLLAEGEDAAPGRSIGLPARATVAGFTAGTVLGGAGVASAMGMPLQDGSAPEDGSNLLPETDVFEDDGDDTFSADALDSEFDEEALEDADESFVLDLD